MNSTSLLSVDESVLLFGELIESCCAVAGAVEGQFEQELVRMEVDALEIGFPTRLDIVTDEEGTVQIGGAPPLHYLDTSFNPVFHQLRLTIVPLPPAAAPTTPDDEE